MSSWEVMKDTAIMSDKPKRNITKEKSQVNMVQIPPDEHTLNQSLRVSISVVRRPLPGAVIIPHIPYITLNERSPITILLLSMQADASIKVCD